MKGVNLTILLRDGGILVSKCGRSFLSSGFEIGDLSLKCCNFVVLDL